ncbi:Tesmin/TSO1-like CXC domain [Sesbania bispinosa]|nr:Tesmin/TSO1-like CXC domain [Sesbania bispinosa]
MPARLSLKCVGNDSHCTVLYCLLLSLDTSVHMHISTCTSYNFLCHEILRRIKEPNKTPDSARHKRGCNCKKSSCLKKYCEFYQGGVGCSVSCRCEGCKNTYGRKDGSPPAERVAEPEEETKAYEKGVVERASQKTEIHNINDHPDCALPTTPSLLTLPFDASKGHQPGSFVTTIPSSGLFGGIGNSIAFRKIPHQVSLTYPAGLCSFDIKEVLKLS